MSANRHAWLRSAAAALVLLAGLACGGGGGGGSSVPSPVVKSITPNIGFSGSSTAVVITGDNFLISPTSSTIRAWLDQTELTGVSRIDVQTLHATVPAGLSAGAKTLRVENALGKSGTLANAFTVTSLARGALTTELGAIPTSGNVGQSFTLQATITNVGTGEVTGLHVTAAATSTDTGAATVTGPQPTSVATLAPGGVATFTWTVVLTSVGNVDLQVSGGASDVFSGLEVPSPSATASILTQLPAGLVATISASRPTLDVGQAVTATLTVTNGGQAAANLASVTPSGIGTCGQVSVAPAVSPQSPVSVPSGGSRSFSWSCTPSAAGTLSLSAGVAGTDANSGQPISATPSAPAVVTVQTAAALSAAIAVDGDPTTASVGQALTVRVTVQNTGGASANISAPVLTPSGSTAACGGVSPATPQTVAGGASVVFGATCTPASTGTLHLAASVTGSDENTGAILSAGANLARGIIVQQPPGLAVIVGASPSTVDVGQAVSLTFTVANGGGGARANGVTVTPLVTGTAPTTCGNVAPGATNIAAGGFQLYTLQCTPTGAGSLVVAGTAAGTDANSGQPVTATTATEATVTVQTAAALGAALSVDGNPTTVSVGQALTVRLTVSDTGGASARVTSVTPSPAGICVAASPTPPQTVTPGGPMTFTWACTASAAGSLTLGASVAGTDLNDGAALSVSASITSPITVETPPSLVATVGASASTVDIGQPLTVTFTVTNGGGAQANGVAVTPSFTGGTCGAAAPTTANIAPNGGSQVYSWACSSTTAGTLTVAGTAAGTDANSNQRVTATPATAATVTVETPAALSAAIAVVGSPITATIGQALTVRLTVTDAGGAPAIVNAVTPSPAGICTGVSPLLPQTVSPGAPVTFSWTCTPSSAGPLTPAASVAGTDRNTGAPLSASASVASPITVQRPPVLVATVAASPTTVDVGQAVTVTFTVTNGGGAQANGVAVTPSVTGGTCGAPAPTMANIAPNGGLQVYSWTCSSSTAGTLTVTGTAAGTDTNTSQPVSATAATAATVTVQTPAALGVAITVDGSPTTVSVGQALTVRLTVSDTGGASATVTSVTPSPAGMCTGVTPLLPQTVTPGAPVSFSWTCTPSAAGSLTLGAAVAGTDHNDGAALSASASLANPITVQTPPALAATVAASPTTVDVGQAVTVTFTVTNGGGAQANGVAVTPSFTGGTCGAAAPATANIAPNGGSQVYSWTCSSTTAGTLTVTGTAAGTDANSSQRVTATPATAASATVQTPAALSASLAATTRTTIDVTQTVSLSLTVNNTGGGSARVTAVTPSPASGAVTCPAAPTQALPVTIAGGGSATFTWACTGASVGAATLDATVTAANVNTGAALSPAVAGVGVTVQTAAALTASLAATTRTTIDVAQAVSLSLTVNNTGGGGAQVTAVTPSPASGTVTCPSGPTQALPMTIAGGGSATFTWVCTGASAGTVTLDATVTGANVNTGAALSPAVAGVGATVQTAAALTASLAATTRTTIDVAQAVSLSLTVNNTGGGGAQVTAVTPSPASGAVTCPSGPTQALPMTIAGGGSATFTWACTGASVGTATLDATVTGTNVNTGAALSPAVTGVGVTVQTAAALNGTLSPATATAGSSVTVTLGLSNVGGATAVVTAASLTITNGTSGTALICTTATPTTALPLDVTGGSNGTLTWSCTAGSTGTTATLQASVTASDLNTGAGVIPSIADLAFTPL